MPDIQIALTDPAREMADLLTVLQGGNVNLQGDKFLAEHFGVPAWSQDFYRILATIMDRLADLTVIIGELAIDDDFRAEMVGHVGQIQAAFSPGTFQAVWHSSGGQLISAKNVQPLKGLSGLVRQKISYRKLTNEEVSELEGVVTELVQWLGAHQLAEQDFIRQALIDGLENLRFRLSKLRWLGWGYTLDSLREVIAAYMLLERQGSTPQDNPDVEAVLAKVRAFIKTVYSKVETVKKVAETGDWLLKMYGTATLAQHVLPVIKALLPSQ